MIDSVNGYDDYVSYFFSGLEDVHEGPVERDDGDDPTASAKAGDKRKREASPVWEETRESSPDPVEEWEGEWSPAPSEEQERLRDRSATLQYARDEPEPSPVPSVGQEPGLDRSPTLLYTVEVSESPERDADC